MTTRTVVEPPRPAFLISIDTEGDDIWSRPRTPTVRNATFLPRFQALCERFGFRPTYLTNWEMAHAPAFVDFGRTCQGGDTAEIGMHLHAWDTPPIDALTADDAHHQPYLIDYPTDVIRDKVARMTDLLETIFARKMTSHRAGRWGFDERYAAVLAEHGYIVDCSVTPHVSWQDHPGAPDGNGGPNYMACPENAYFMDPGDIRRAGSGALLQVPMSIVRTRPSLPMALARRLLRKTPDRTLWLRPNGRNLKDMFAIVGDALEKRRSHLQFTLHSAELMPDGSPTFRTERSIELLYEHMAALFEYIGAHFAGMTLSEFARRYGKAREIEL